MTMLTLTPTTGLLVATISSIAINRISFILANTKFIYPKNVRESNQSYYYWRYRNFFISFIHAFITGVGSLLCVLSNPMLLLDVVDTASDWGYLLTAFSLGYFIYDTVEMAAYLKKKGTAELLLHHFFVISCFLNTVMYKRFIGYNMLALLIEISNVFLHFRQLLLLSKHSKLSSLYRINSVTNIVLFVLVRGACMFGLWYTLILFIDRLPFITKLTAIISMIGISITTVILFQRIWNSDFVSISEQRRKKLLNENSNSCSKNSKFKMNQYEDDFTYEGSIEDVKSGMVKKSN
ncbi:TLC domain-containing protein 2 [Dermatophagoides farinae]|uniref:TLC domain-containing protein 2 n=1 Tax=Dermatophagoides farinae TaxID=6954 RepID=A0A922L7W4_DERFA|nr:TLC domain-containing protein 2-like [Dermatophagoides farinae]KAH9516612.1 TLC domain-containing protein 2 [Dermatophagoides farinae]